MAKAREVFFNSEGRTTKGQLILLSLDGVDEAVAVDEFEFTVIDLGLMKVLGCFSSQYLVN